MTNIMTNHAAMSALQTLRSVSSELQKTQSEVSSGLRIATASDNAAYWSISTTMRSDHSALSAVQDALGLGAAKVDTAYAGMDAVIDVLIQFTAKLVAAKESDVDKSKVQSELDQLKEQVLSIATSASFSGQSWLNTDITDIYDSAVNRSSVVSSFVRTSSGVSVKTVDVDLSRVSLFNSTGGGILQADARDIRTIGGIRSLVSITDPSNIGGDYTRYDGVDGSSGYMLPEWNTGNAGRVSLQFPNGTPLDFNSPGAEISFTITLDREASNPDAYNGVLGENQELPGPYYDGYTATVTITKADIDTYNSDLGGVISTNTQFAEVLNAKLYPLGASVAGNYTNASTGLHNPTLITITTLQQHGYGSHVEISAVASSGVSTGGLKADFDFGYRGSGLALDFKPFIVHRDGKDENGIDVSFTFSVNGASPQVYSFNRSYVNEVLGRDDGKVATSEDMATLLQSMLDDDWPDLVIGTSAGYVVIKSNPDIDRQWGTGTRIEFNNIRVSNEPRSTLNFLDIDILQNPDQIDAYIAYLETASANVIDGAAMLGTVQTRIDLQSEFASRLYDSINRGIGRLIDADTDEASTRLKALQAQQQLANSGLQIANSEPQVIMTLFRQ